MGHQLFFLIFYLGSHKRSHSLGDKEIRRSPPSPAPEQPFRDRSNTLSEKPALPVIRDKYKDLTGEVEVRGINCTADDFITCFKGYKSRLWLSLVLSTVAGEWALRVRVAKVSGKRSGGLWLLFESLHNGMFCPLPSVQIDYSTLYTQSHGFKNTVYHNTGACVVTFKVITNANNILNSISSSSVCTEVIQSAQGMEYLLGREPAHIQT